MSDPSLIFTGLGGTVLKADTVGNDMLDGSMLAGPTTFHVVGLTSGNDTIKGMGKNDILVVDQKIFDGNKDGIINYGKNGVLDLDGPDAGIDTVTFVDGPEALRFLGASADGKFVYADSSVRLAGFKEGNLSNNNMSGDAANLKADTFFFDTALDLNWGKDSIKNFGSNDQLVTTSAIFDSNADGKIDFYKNGLLDLSGDAGLGHAGPQNDSSPWGQVAITAVGGAAVTALYLQDTTIVNDVTYYYYGLTASA